MKKIISLLALPAMLFAACNGGGGTANSDGSISLKFNFDKGSKYKYVVKTRQGISQEMMGKSITVNQDMDMESTYEVSGAEGSNKKLTVTYDRIAMKSNSAGTDMSYDSDDSANSSPALASLGNMVHKPFSMTVNEQGQIVSIQGFRELMPDAAGSPLSDSSLRSMMQQAFYIYPGKPVKPGDTWTNSYTASLGFMDMTTDNTYKLVSVADGKAHIELTSKISTHPTDNPEMKDMKLEMSGVQTGAMDIEVSTGLMMGSTMNQQIKGSIDMMGTKAPMQINSDITIIGTKLK